MCSRFSLTQKEIKLQNHEFEILFGVVARYNIAPSQKTYVIRERAGQLLHEEMQWGWKAAWSKLPLINAQAETVTEKSTFRKYLHQRCLVPANGFYEWTRDKTPIRFTTHPGCKFRRKDR